MTKYTINGKQVLQDGKHFADAVSEHAAMLIVAACGAVASRSRLDTRWPKVFRQPPRWSCQVERQGDELACSCGLRWAVNEDDPH